MSDARLQPMSPRLRGSWWAFALHGLVAVLFGLLVIIWPGFALFTLPLLLLLGTYILIDGMATIVAGTRASGSRRWLLLVEGALGIGIDRYVPETYYPHVEVNGMRHTGDY